MLKTECIHPEIMAVLAKCGHGSKILIADGNYPLAEKGGGVRVYLGVKRGLPQVTEVLNALHTAVEFEKAEVMVPDHGEEPEIFSQFRTELEGMELQPLSREAFYQACMEPGAVMLSIQTGEQRTFANILLTIGCA